MRYLVSGLIVLHLWAVVAEPLRFSARGPGGPSPALTAFYRPLRPYIEFCYLNQGYAFFAPDPGPSHLLQANLTFADGRKAVRRYPDLAEHRPRLLYHRYFMLSEFYNGLFRPALPPRVTEPGVPEPLDGDRFAEAVFADTAFAAERRMYERVGDSYRRAIAAESGASEVELMRLEHRLPGVAEVLVDRLRLNDPSLYLTMPEVIEVRP